MSTSDSVEIDTIAHLCPNMYGNVVFKARTIYTMIYNEIQAWDNDLACGIITEEGADSGGGEDSTGQRRTMPSIGAAGNNMQQYNLFPNPNNGNITLQQTIADEKPVSIDVLNAIGQVVSKKQLIFTSGIGKLHLQNLVSGLYMIVLKDCEGESYTLKFIVN